MSSSVPSNSQSFNESTGQSGFPADQVLLSPE